MKKFKKQLFALIGISLLGIGMAIASSESDCSDDDVEPPETHSAVKAINKNT